jgi:ubiquinone/menaquinone biosynthesis C-methylase UbiE
MSTYVLMRILESAPERYDLGMRLLGLGRLERAYDRLAGHIGGEQRVLDVGCGTGALAVRAALQGARVKGIDVNPDMLAIAVRRAEAAGVADRIELVEMGVADLDEEAPGYDAVTCGLCLSELSPDEISYTLRQVVRLLKPGGLLLAADEVRPLGLLRRAFHWLLRAPLVAITYVVTQQTTHVVANLAGSVTAVGLVIESIRESTLRSFVEIVARKAGATP